VTIEMSKCACGAIQTFGYQEYIGAPKRLILNPTAPGWACEMVDDKIRPVCPDCLQVRQAERMLGEYDEHLRWAGEDEAAFQARIDRYAERGVTQEMMRAQFESLCGPECAAHGCPRCK
jgi:hypothetical protein